MTDTPETDTLEPLIHEDDLPGHESQLEPKPEWEPRYQGSDRLKGKVVEVTRGQTTVHGRIDIGGAVITASITNEAVDDLQLKVGDEAYAVVKASDVMVGKD